MLKLEQCNRSWIISLGLFSSEGHANYLTPPVGKLYMKCTVTFELKVKCMITTLIMIFIMIMITILEKKRGSRRTGIGVLTFPLTRFFHAQQLQESFIARLEGRLATHRRLTLKIARVSWQEQWFLL
jgi:hypothetical protein